MEDKVVPEFTISGAIALFNQILDTATPTISVTGEVANFKVNQGKWVFFDLKDDSGIINCFMSLYSLRVALEDGMTVSVVGHPGITKWGHFSLTIKQIHPKGEGSIRKSFELLKKKLTAEGLFAIDRKRSLPGLPEHIGVISSTGAAGYSDFIKILNERMGGLTIDVISTQVQGQAAPDQIIGAIRQFNELPNPPEVLAILRGGGSRDDLAVFDDEQLVRAIASSRIPTITGIGHEIDTTLADLASDKRASTPSNAAQLLVPDKREIISDISSKMRRAVDNLKQGLDDQNQQVDDGIDSIRRSVHSRLDWVNSQLDSLSKTLQAYNPKLVLARGYSLLWNDGQHHILGKRPTSGDKVVVELDKYLIDAEVLDVRSKK